MSNYAQRTPKTLIIHKSPPIICWTRDAVAMVRSAFGVDERRVNRTPTLRGNCMVIPSQKHVRNSLLSRMHPDDYAAIETVLEPVTLKRKDVLIQPGQPLTHMRFIESGVASVVVGTREGRRIEVGIIGSEGASGLPLLFDVESTPHETFMQIDGEALQVDKASFRNLVEERPAFRKLMMRYAHIFQLLTAQTALSHGSYTLEERLARWLLMCHDRVSGDEFPITHEFLSVMLGVHRPGVTTTIHILEGAGTVRARRSHIEIVNRDKLKLIAGESYGIPEAEYRRLIAEDAAEG
ncbi:MULTISPECIES: Crp/Fnr family transcriptional regulator [unclassified Methylobacterium]|uniref:Crp/Fnr family transcriptional regulator n=1 Tax=unclassified Methylobacterium TaxID=2615210 RepID=UPI001FCD819C|nr:MULTISPECIES: Crp/Fnr family transcriptional regulator [unclassified Methylobacterium]